MCSLEAQQRRGAPEPPGDHSQFRYRYAQTRAIGRKDVSGREMDWHLGYRMTKKREEAKASEMKPGYELCTYLSN